MSADVEVVRVLAAFHFEKARIAAGDHSGRDAGPFPGTHAAAIVGIEKYLDRLHELTALQHFSQRAGCVFEAGFDLGMAVAVEIMNDSLGDPMPGLSDAFASARAEIENDVREAQEASDSGLAL